MDHLLGQGVGGRSESGMGTSIARFPAALRTSILRLGSALGGKITRTDAPLGSKIMRTDAALAVPWRPSTVDAELLRP